MPWPRQKRRATVRRYLASLNHLHRAAGLPVPGQAEPVRLAPRRMGRAKGVRQKQAAPLGYDRLRRILEALGDRPADLRDAALLALAYDSLARRSELVALDLEDIGRDGDGSGTALIRRSNTDQEYYHVAAVPAARQCPQGRPARRGRPKT